MAADGSLNFDTNINTEGFNNGVKNVGSSLGGLKSALGKVALAVGAAFSVKAIVNFSKSAIDTASDMAEVQNVVDTAFGSMSGKMEEFADTSIKQFGISRLAAKQTGSTFMAMASGMGIAQNSASDMAIALTGLSADMASFYNVTQDVASTALKSIFTGETETLKQFGIVMTDANLQAFALSQGISKQTSEMSQAEKVQLRYAYVMQQTSLAQGDFAKTANSWANQTRILSEQWKEFKSVIGSALVGVILPAVKVLNNALSSLISYATAAVKALSNVFGIKLNGNDSNTSAMAKDTTKLADNSANAADNYSDMEKSAKKAQKATEKSLASFDKINKLGSPNNGNEDSGKLSGKIPAVGTPVSYGGGSIKAPAVDTSELEKKLTEFFKKVKSIFDKLKEVFRKIGEYFKKNFAPIFKEIFDKISNQARRFRQTLEKVFNDIKSLAEPLKQYFVNDFTPFLQTVFRTLGDIVAGLLDTFNMVFADIWNVAVFPILQNFITTGLPMITQFATLAVQTIGNLFNSVKEIFDTVWTEGVVPILSEITTIWTDFVNLLKSKWDKYGKPIFDGINKAITGTKDLILTTWSTYIKPIVDKVVKTVDDLWEKHIKPLADNIGDFVGELITFALMIYNKVILPILNWVVKTLYPPISKVVQSIVKLVGKYVGNIVDHVNSVITALRGIIQFITGVFQGDWRGAWQGIKKIFKGIWDTFAGIVKTPINAIIGLINKMLGAVETAINSMVKSINKLSFKAPDWLPKKYAGKKFGFDLKTVSLPEIPKLAQGAVIPPNSEFLAVLGDQKHGTNVEAPLATIEEAVMSALVKLGLNGGGGNNGSITVNLSLDGKVIASKVIDNINEFTKRCGRSPLNA